MRKAVYWRFQEHKFGYGMLSLGLMLMTIFLGGAMGTTRMYVNDLFRWLPDGTFVFVYIVVVMLYGEFTKESNILYFLGAKKPSVRLIEGTIFLFFDAIIITSLFMVVVPILMPGMPGQGYANQFMQGMSGVTVQYFVFAFATLIVGIGMGVLVMVVSMALDIPIGGKYASGIGLAFAIDSLWGVVLSLVGGFGFNMLGGFRSIPRDMRRSMLLAPEITLQTHMYILVIAAVFSLVMVCIAARFIDRRVSLGSGK